MNKNDFQINAEIIKLEDGKRILRLEKEIDPSRPLLEQAEKLQDILKIKGKELWLRCSCGTECLNLEVDSFSGGYDLYLAIFSQDMRVSLFQRWRYILQVLWAGKPFNDNLVLKEEDVQKLKEFLNNL